MLIGNHNLVVVGINSADTGRSFDTPYAEAKAFDTVFVRYDDAVEDWRRILQLADGLRTGDSEEEDWRRMTVEVEDMRRIGSRLTTDGRRTGETSSEATGSTPVPRQVPQAKLLAANVFDANVSLAIMRTPPRFDSLRRRPSRLLAWSSRQFQRTLPCRAPHQKLFPARRRL